MLKKIAFTILVVFLMFVLVCCGEYQAQKTRDCNCDCCIHGESQDEQDRYNEYEGWDY